MRFTTSQKDSLLVSSCPLTPPHLALRLTVKLQATAVQHLSHATSWAAASDEHGILPSSPLKLPPRQRRPEQRRLSINSTHADEPYTTGTDLPNASQPYSDAAKRGRRKGEHCSPRPCYYSPTDSDDDKGIYNDSDQATRPHQETANEQALPRHLNPP